MTLKFLPPVSSGMYNDLRRFKSFYSVFSMHVYTKTDALYASNVNAPH